MLTQLYEQGADHRRIGKYVRNWLRWVRAGVEISVIKILVTHQMQLCASQKTHAPDNTSSVTPL